VIEILESLKKDIIPVFFNIQCLVFLSVLLISVFILHAKSVFKEWYLQMLIPVLCLLCYLMLFFKVFGEHDYYLINMLPVLVIITGLVLKFTLYRFPAFLRQKWIQVTLLLIVIVLTHQTAVLTRARIEMTGWGFDSIVLTQEKREYFEWNTWYDRSRYQILEEISEGTLNTLGLTKDQRVLCLGDLTINRSLFLLNRLGYTSFRRETDKIDEFITQHKAKGLHYLIVIDWDKLPKGKLAPYLKHKVYEKEGTSIYKLP
jgi:hypothetical protein